MKGTLAILGLVACATAFQYTIPQNGMLYGLQNQAYDDNFLTGIYNRFHGPYNTEFYQKRFGSQKHQESPVYDQYKDSDVYQKTGYKYQDAQNHQEDTQGKYDFYNALYNNDNLNKMYKGVYNKFYGKLQNLMKNYQDDSAEYQGVYGKVQEEFGSQYESQDFLKKQKDVHQLLKFINSPVYDNEYHQIYKTFDIEKFSQYYQPEAYKTFMHYWENQMFLPKGEIFSIFNEVHVQQVEALFKLFYTAKDYQTFIKTAIWARQHINEGMFLYTFSVAVIHRDDTQGIALPPIYEIYPQYFFNSEVMQKAYKFKMSHFGNKQMVNKGVYTIPSNYSGFYLNLNPEQSLSYYTEDVGINAFYYYYNLHFPYWMDSQEYPIHENRGAMFYYIHQQILARYYLERLSHGVGGFEYFNWEVPFETGYYPSLTYPNGLAFSERPNFANLQEYFANYGQHWCFIGKYGYAYTYVQTYEQRIREAIDLGYVYTLDGKKVDLYTPEGFNVLGNIIEGNADSINLRYYGSYVNFARHLLGYAKQPLDNYKLAPSALEHYETSLRDPAFYKLFKKITLLFQKYKVNLPAYTKKDLYYPGVKVEKVEVDPLVTYYDEFHADITNGLTVTPEEFETDSAFRVQVQQYRLNHKNFNYKIYLNSDKTTKATVKVFIGPKYDEHGRTMDFYENRMNFFELDQFVYTVKTGQNMIVRNSREFTWYVEDSTSYIDMYKNIMTNKGENINYVHDAFDFGFPQRYMLPRGTEEGMTYQMYVIVYPYVPYQGQETQNFYHAKFNQYNDQKMTYNTKFDQYDEQKMSYFNKFSDNTSQKMTTFKMIMLNKYPWGYPFDRPAEFEHVYYVPNAYMKDIKIYHKILKTEVETKNYFNEEPRYFM